MMALPTCRDDDWSIDNWPIGIWFVDNCSVYRSVAHLKDFLTAQFGGRLKSYLLFALD